MRNRRHASVWFRVTNAGPGDAFGASIVGITSDPGVVARTALPRDLGDLADDESVNVRVRYKVKRSACERPTSCRFETTLSLDAPNALDEPNVGAETFAVKIPTK